jgi:hypothetical protein
MADRNVALILFRISLKLIELVRHPHLHTSNGSAQFCEERCSEENQYLQISYDNDKALFDCFHHLQSAA